MTRPSKTLSCLVTIALAMASFITPLSPAWADSTTDLQATQAQLEQQLADIENQIAQYEKQLSQTQGEKKH